MRGNIEQAWVNRLKILRTAIRLKYAIDADNALNVIIDAERKAFYKEVQQGRLPKPLDPQAALAVVRHA